ncbi:hypothetical protein C2S52_017295 [Perilla frutescens var. hirtella]|nr:hypothetical protein C2S52_017295 [Perilla frutescens var. hirtella]
MKKAIGGRGKSSYITGDPAPPSTTDPAYKRWEQDDQCVFTWLVQNIESNLVSTISKHPTSKDVWDSLALTYGSGTDSLQVFDLHRRANTIKQGEGTLEEIWAKMQEIWISIDRKEPNPMECPKDIETYNRIIHTQKVYQFLMALSDKYEPVKKEILKKDLLPSVETAYAMVHRETARDLIFQPVVFEDSRDTSSDIGFGLAARDRVQKGYKGKGARQTEEDRSKMVCSHCGMKKHTKESCFQLVGYPDWWDDTKRTKLPNHARNQGGSIAATMTADRATNAEVSTGTGNFGAAWREARSEGNIAEANARAAATRACEGNEAEKKEYLGPSIKPNYTWTFFGKNNSKKNAQLPSNCGKSEKTPILCTKKFQVLDDVSIACTVPDLITGNTGQWIFDCGATDTMTFDISDIDIRTGEIIGCGTERRGLYYVDEIAPKGVAMLTHGPEVLATSVYLINRLPTKALNLQTPLQALSTQAQIPMALTLKPRVFGCSVFVHLPKTNHHKFSPCAVKCVFIGYGVHQKGYRCYDPKSRHMFTTMNCDFLENEYFFHHLTSQGESMGTSDSLSWLTMPDSVPIPETGPTDEVNNTAEISSDTVQSTVVGDHASETFPRLTPEVRASNDISNSSSFLEDNTTDNGENVVSKETGTEDVLDSECLENSADTESQPELSRLHF